VREFLNSTLDRLEPALDLLAGYRQQLGELLFEPVEVEEEPLTVDGVTSIVVRKADGGILYDTLVCLVKGSAPYSCCPLKPECHLLLLVKCLDEEGLHHAVDPEQIQVLDVLVKAPLGAARAGRRDVITLGSLNQSEGDQNLERVVQVCFPMGSIRGFDGSGPVERRKPYMYRWLVSSLLQIVGIITY